MKKRAFLFIILSGLLWGTSGIFVPYLAPFGFSSLQMTFFRTAFSAAVMMIYALLRDRSLFKVSFKELLLFAGSGLALYGTASCYYFSMQVTSVSTAVVLMYTAPVIVMIYSVAFLGEKLTRLKLVSVAAMLVGCCLVSGIIGGMRFDVFGIIMGFLSGISYSAYNIFTKIQMRRKSNPVSATVYTFLFGTLFAFVTCSPSSAPAHIAANPSVTVPLLAAMAVCTCVLPYFFYTLALKDLPAGTASALGIVEPMAATVYSVVLFDEQLSLYSLCGIVLILGAVFLLSKSDN